MKVGGTAQEEPWEFGDYFFVAVSWALVVAGAAVWMAAAFGVGFPKELAMGDFSGAFIAFFHSLVHPVALAFLLGVDIFIAIMFVPHHDARPGFKGRIRLGLALAAVILYLVVALILPIYNMPLVTAHAIGLGLFALMLVGIPRALSYGVPQLAHAVSGVPPANSFGAQ
tara:strand:+ start:8000 stop:8506 length:507 start_codon:yes stop_codon:yes gene_type:complete